MIEKKEISGWAFTQTIRECSCPRCHANVNEYCCSPKGVKTKFPHAVRVKEYVNKIGQIEFSKRHVKKLLKINFKFMGLL